MLSSETMNKMDIIILDKHLDEVVAKLGFSSSFEIIECSTKENPASSHQDRLSRFVSLKDKLFTYIHKTGIVFKDAELNLEKDFILDLDVIEEKLSFIENEIGADLEKLEDVISLRNELIGILRELGSFGYIDIDLKTLSDFEFTYMLYGRLPKSKLSQLSKAGEGRSVFIPLGTEGDVIALSSKKGKWALSSELRKLEFEQKEFLGFKEGNIKDLITQTQNKLDTLNLKYNEIESRLSDFTAGNRHLFLKLLLSINVLEDILGAAVGFGKTTKSYHISGWIEKSALEEVIKTIEEITLGTCFIQVKDTSEAGINTKDIPVKFKKRRFISSFEVLVKNFGLPRYGEIDPTIFVAITYMLMFGMMFGDIGQGAVFFILGLVLKINKINALKRFNSFAILFMGMGIFSCAFGFLYGSVFGSEHLVAPLLVNPLKNFKILFLIALAFGILFITTGIIINIINLIVSKKYYDAFFDKSGILGIWFYWGSLTVLLRSIVFKKAFSFKAPIVIALFAAPVALVILKPFIHWIIEKKHGHKGEGIFVIILESIIETIETFVYYLGNTASFIRMGALTLSHAALSYAIFTIAGITRGSAAGNFAGIVIIVGGNLFIIVLEGLVAAIQTMRLQYYEFFSKFFSGDGKGFKPFKIEKIKKRV